MHQTTDAIVIGGGISGTAAAYELARAGVRTTLIEKGSLASMASGWTLAGVRQSGRHPAETPLARAAVRRWEDLDEELGMDVEYRQHGNLRLARTPEEVSVIAGIVQEQQALGLDLTYLPDNAAVRAVAPALAESVMAASFCPTDGHANPVLAVQAFGAAAARHGATLLTETEVTAIEVVGERVRGVQTATGRIAAETVVVAAGVYSHRLVQPLGIDLPLEIVQAGIVQTVPLPPLLEQVLGVANGNVALRQQADGRLRMTGDAVPWVWPDNGVGDDDVQPPASLVAAILERSWAVLPPVAKAKVARVWGGLLDMTPDALPVIERVPELEGLIIAAGFSGHGFCLGPATGSIIRELVTAGRSTLPLAPFRRARFTGPLDPGRRALHG
jgi:sarcosine oxidase subunit beta